MSSVNAYSPLRRIWARRSNAFSANIKERQDYSCAIFDQHGELLCHAAHIPVPGNTPLSVRAAIEKLSSSRAIQPL